MVFSLYFADTFSSILNPPLHLYSFPFLLNLCFLSRSQMLLTVSCRFSESEVASSSVRYAGSLEYLLTRPLLQIIVMIDAVYQALIATFLEVHLECIGYLLWLKVLCIMYVAVCIPLVMFHGILFSFLFLVCRNNFLRVSP